MTALAQALPRPSSRGSSLALDAALVIFGSLLVAALAQIDIHLTPYVPITGQTLGVLLIGAALGSVRGGLSLGLYLAQGAVGLPFFAGAASGVPGLSFPTGGYLWGFVIAAFLVGWLAERGWDRSFASALGAMFIGELIIFAVGVPWLANAVGLSAEQALAAGLYPFVIGDTLKLLLAAALLPAAWRLIGRNR
ncbi:MAG TPA: biotin transporter BioY [Actinomycetota bacterium]|nr:biotin transporter BioY [Actinomycetota bacterium]